MNGVTGRAGVRERRNWNSDDLKKAIEDVGGCPLGEQH